MKPHPPITPNHSETLSRSSLRRALAHTTNDVSAALAEIGWQEFVDTDEGLAFTSLFEELGYAGASTDALDIAAASVLGCSYAGVPVVWPLHDGESAEEVGGSGQLFAEGVLLNAQRTAARTIFVSAGGRMRLLTVSAISPSDVNDIARDSGWVRVRAWGTPVAELSSWPFVKRRGLLAVASELAGVADRIVDVIGAEVSGRRRHADAASAVSNPASSGCEAGSAIAVAKTAIAAAWQGGSLAAAPRARATARAAFDVVAMDATDQCDALGRNAEQLLGLIRRGLTVDSLMRVAPGVTVAGH